MEGIAALLGSENGSRYRGVAATVTPVALLCATKLLTKETLVEVKAAPTATQGLSLKDFLFLFSHPESEGKSTSIGVGGRIGIPIVNVRLLQLRERVPSSAVALPAPNCTAESISLGCFVLLGVTRIQCKSPLLKPR